MDDEQVHWTSFKIARHSPPSIVYVYAVGNASNRSAIWRSLFQLKGPLILVGDLNMVENCSDRYKGLGQVISGTEKDTWETLVEAFSLIDIGEHGQFS